MPPRQIFQIFSAIVYVLRTGCQWKALPREFGSASAVHKHFQQWQQAGFFLALWRAGLAEYDEMEGVGLGLAEHRLGHRQGPAGHRMRGSQPYGSKKMGASEVCWSTRVASRCRSSPAEPMCRQFLIGNMVARGCSPMPFRRWEERLP